MTNSVLAEALRHAHQQLFVYLDRTALKVARQFNEERARTLQGSTTLRTQTVMELLSGRPPRPTAMDRLAYGMAHHHVAFICWLDPEASESTQTLENLTADIAGVLGTGQSLLVNRDSREARGWVHVAPGFRDNNRKFMTPGAGAYSQLTQPECRVQCRASPNAGNYPCQ